MRKLFGVCETHFHIRIYKMFVVCSSSNEWSCVVFVRDMWLSAHGNRKKMCVCELRVRRDTYRWTKWSFEWQQIKIAIATGEEMKRLNFGERAKKGLHMCIRIAYRLMQVQTPYEISTLRRVAPKIITYGLWLKELIKCVLCMVRREIANYTFLKLW